MYRSPPSLRKGWHCESRVFIGRAGTAQNGVPAMRASEGCGEFGEGSLWEVWVFCFRASSYQLSRLSVLMAFNRAVVMTVSFEESDDEFESFF